MDANETKFIRSGEEFLKKEENFEDPNFLNYWETDRLVPDGYEVVDAPNRLGEKALKLTVKRGDFARPIDNPTRERCELGELSSDSIPEGDSISYELSFFVPEDFHIANNRLVIMQFRTNETPNKENPPMALRYIDGDLFFTIKDNDKWIELFRVKKDDFIMAKWHDVKIDYGQDSDHNGNISVSVDGQIMGTYSGHFGYNHLATDMHFRFGLYRDRFPDTEENHPQSLLFNRFRRKVTHI